MLADYAFTGNYGTILDPEVYCKVTVMLIWDPDSCGWQARLGVKSVETGQWEQQVITTVLCTCMDA